jgi:hypothetical protein
MAFPDGGLRDRNIPARGASFSEITAFATTLSPCYPSLQSDARASLNANGHWEGTLSQLCNELFFEVRAIHHVMLNDPDSAQIEFLYTLLDAIRSRASAALRGS